MEKKVTINEKEYIVKEIPYIEAVDTNPNDKKEMIRKLFKASAGLTDEEINSLTLKQGFELQQVVDEVNGLSDFLKAAEKIKSEQS